MKGQPMYINNLLNSIKFYEINNKTIGIILNNLPTKLKLDINKQLKEFSNIYNLKNINFTNGIHDNTIIKNTITIIIEFNDDYYVKNNLINPYLNYLWFIKQYNLKPYESMLITNQYIALTIGGLILQKILELKYSIKFITHISRIADITDVTFNEYNIKNINHIKDLKPCILDNRVKILMEKAIKKASNNNLTLSGSLETMILEIPNNINNNTYSLKQLSSFLLSDIPNLSVIEYNNGSNFNKTPPNKYIKFDNDKLLYNNEAFIDNNTGKLNSNKFIIKCDFIPDPSNKEISTINFETLENFIVIKEKIKPIEFLKYTYTIESILSISLYEIINKEG
jgi:chorismate synthase